MQNQTPNKNTPLLAAFTVNFLWGFDFIGLDYLARYFPSGFIAFSRVFISMLLIFLLTFIREGHIRINRKDWPLVFISGAAGITLYFYFESLGVSLTSGAFGSLVLATVPILGVIGDRIFFKKPITPIKTIAILASMGGVTMVILGDPDADVTGNFLGILVLLGAAVMWVAYIILVKPINEKYSLLQAMSGLYISGVICMLPLLIMDIGKLHPVPATPVIVLLGSTFLFMFVCELLSIYAIKYLSVTTVAAFENLIPLVTLIFSFLLFHETLTLVQIAGGVIIMAAVTCVSLQEGKE